MYARIILLAAALTAAAAPAAWAHRRGNENHGSTNFAVVIQQGNTNILGAYQKGNTNVLLFSQTPLPQKHKNGCCNYPH